MTDFRADLYRAWTAVDDGDPAAALRLMPPPDVAGGATTAVELAVEDQAAPDPGADPHAEHVPVRTSGAAGVLAADGDADVVVDDDVDPVERLGEEGPELDAVGESGHVRGQRHDTGGRIDLTGRPDTQAGDRAVSAGLPL